MAGFEPRTSGVGSNRSANWATTTAPNDNIGNKNVYSIAPSFCFTTRQIVSLFILLAKDAFGLLR